MHANVLSPNPGPHILYIDDEEALTDIGKRRLQSLGYEVSAHCSSQAALAAFQEMPDRFDAVITDLNMPDLDGLELARKISAIRPEVPIILCTGDRSAFTDEQILACGIGEIVLKPLFKKDLAVLFAKLFC